MRIGLLLPLVLLLFPQSVLSINCADRQTELGANHNMTPRTLRPELVHRSGVEWFRGMVDMYEVQKLLARQRKAERVQDGGQYQSLQKGEDSPRHENRHLLEMVFQAREMRDVPIRDSAEEQKLFATMRYVLDELAEYSDILIAGNEPIIETYVEDMQSVGRGDDAFTPMSDFYIRVADYIHR